MNGEYVRVFDVYSALSANTFSLRIGGIDDRDLIDPEEIWSAVDQLPRYNPGLEVEKALKRIEAATAYEANPGGGVLEYHVQLTYAIKEIRKELEGK